MIEIIPFMLFLIEWHPDRAGEFDLQRQPVVFRTLEECEAEGTKLADERNMSASDGLRYQFACTEIPRSEKISDAFDREIERKLERDLGSRK
ncbi:hypothetical protein [Pontixanthobacter aquaemixtae]|uniref:Uncharacterized protein n=1 Tax=Pontixanthobacter aquaemixtae TaxID=1958940 RepID=A0A844ZRH6_9SPHN|nr:hypothetical protein [Pontixanthobacter aquaemixtae]MXO90443.1 hypothetical protein [Pontixanthobacter aquaemixtae]